jgi:hypothetical protein
MELASHGFVGWTPGQRDGWAPEALALVTGHSAFAKLDFEELRQVGLRVVLDGRRFWKADALDALGLTYVGVGRGDMPLNTRPPGVVGAI